MLFVDSTYLARINAHAQRSSVRMHSRDTRFSCTEHALFFATAEVIFNDGTNSPMSNSLERIWRRQRPALRRMMYPLLLEPLQPLLLVSQSRRDIPLSLLSTLNAFCFLLLLENKLKKTNSSSCVLSSLVVFLLLLRFHFSLVFIFFLSFLLFFYNIEKKGAKNKNKEATSVS